MSQAPSRRFHREAREPRRILHLGDDPNDAEMVKQMVLGEWPRCQIVACSSGQEFCAALEAEYYDAILSDFSMPGFDGLAALRLTKEQSPDTPFIFVSGTIGEDRAMEAVRAGADDWVVKDRMKRLVTAIRRSLNEVEERRLRREAERRLREQAEMLNQAREAIVVVDLQGRVLHWNAGAERLFGWTTEEASRSTLMDLFSPEAVRGLEKVWFETLASGSWEGELHLHDKHGRDVFVETRRTLVRDDEGLPKAHLSISTDITEKKKMQEQLLRSQRIENIGLLAAGIAHDLNNMLAPVVMASQMLRLSTGDAESLKWIGMVQTSADRGIALIRQLLAFVHGASGERRRVEIESLVGDIAGMVTSTFPRGISFKASTEPDLWAVTGNPTQLNQVLLNLCINARDAMPNGGTLNVRAHNCILREDAASAIPAGKPGAYVRLDVEDTGTGIPSEVQARMWEPFFTTKPAGLGTGLGLSTVRGIVETHGGFVIVRSSPGTGTCFSLFFPAQGVATAEDPVRSGVAKGRGGLILVVDDEEPIRILASTLLSRAGYRVETASNGTEAVNHCVRHWSDIALVICDTQMPGVSGPNLAGALRRLLPRVKILAMGGPSTGSPTHWKDAAQPAVTDGFLVKPFSPERLLGTVEQLACLDSASEKESAART